MQIGQVAQQQESQQQALQSNTSEQQSILDRERKQLLHYQVQNQNYTQLEQEHRSTTHQKLSDGNNTDKQITNQNPHGLNKWQKHCNKNWIVKESKTHCFEVPFHTTAGTQWHPNSAQNRYLGQHCKHIHKVCHSRSPQQTSLQRWASEPQQQLTLPSRQFHKQVSQACIQKQQQ